MSKVEKSNKFYLYFSTQNTRVKGETPKQRLEVPDAFAPHIESIIKSYPSYVQLKSFKTDDKDGL